MKQIYLAFLLTLILPLGLSAQSKFEMGVQSGFGRFTPQVVRLYSTGYNNNSMENGWAWSAGAFGRYNFREWLKPQVEVNLYNGQSHLTFEHVNYSDVTEEPVWGKYPNTWFRQAAVSVGAQVYLKKSFFVLPAIEFAHSYGADLQTDPNDWNWHLGFGFSIRYIDLILDYSEGMHDQFRYFDRKQYGFASEHRNRFLQLKVQVPLYHF